MDLVINANNFPIYTIAKNAQFEPLFLPPDGSRKRFCIGWKGLGRFKAGTLLIWKNGESIAPGVDFTEESNGLFFNFTVAPAASENYKDYTVSYVPREEDFAFATGSTGSTYESEEYFLFPNWIEAEGCGDGFWIGKYIASRNSATSTGEGTGTIPVAKKNIIPWCNLTFAAASAAAAAKGNAFHMVRNREWCNVALWCKLMNLYPEGNIASGVDGVGIAGTPDATCSGRTLAGTGPVTWNHNLRDSGIADMVGNVWEMIDGVQLVNGTLWISDVNNSLINTGIAPTFGTSGNAFSLLRTDAIIAKDCIPASGTGIPYKGSDGFWFANSGTMVLYRGGPWSYGSLCGLFTFSVSSAASYASTSVGFRLAKSL